MKTIARKLTGYDCESQLEGCEVTDVFDTYAACYSSAVDNSISASGENAFYFAHLKAQVLRSVVGPLSGEHILDFGCGVGLLAHAICDKYSRASVIGFDTSIESVVAARRACRNPNVRFVHGGANLPFPSGHFTAAVSANVFHHIRPGEREHWMAEVARVTRRDGAVLIFEHNPYNPLTRRAVRLCPFDEGVQLLTARETAALLVRAGLKILGSRNYFFFPRALRLLRPIERAIAFIPLGAQYYVYARHQQ